MLKETKDPQKVAQELSARSEHEAGLKWLQETGFIKPGDDVKDIGNSQQFEAVIAPLNNPNDVGDRTGVKRRLCDPHVG